MYTKHCLIALWIFMGVWGAGLSGEEDVLVSKRPVPEQAKLDEIKPFILEIVMPDLEAFKNKDLSVQACGEKMESYVEQAQESASRYALFKLAMDFYADNGCPRNALDILQKLNEHFQIDMKKETLQILALSLKNLNADNAEPLMETIQQTYQQYTDDSDFNTCSEIARLVSRNLRFLSKTPSYEKFMKTRLSIQSKIKEQQALINVQNKLKQTPADPVLNRQCAELLIVLKGDWNHAYDYIMKSGDETWSQYAKLEKAEKVDETNAKAIGDFYWNLADRTKGNVSTAYRKHAAAYYAMVVEKQSGLFKVMLERRISEAESAVEESPALENAVPDVRNAWKLIQATFKKGNTLKGPGKLVAELLHHCGSEAFYGGVLLKNGNVLLVPHHSSKILIYNPKSNKIEKECLHKENEWAFCGGVLLPSGDVVLIPDDAANILIYSPSQNKIVKRVQKGQGSFRGGVLLPNGMVFLVPGLVAERIAIFNPAQGKIIRQCELPELDKNTMNFAGAVLLPSGNVYLAPLGGKNQIYIYDYRKNNIVQKIQAHSGGFIGGALTPTGEVVSISMGKNIPALLSDEKKAVQICLCQQKGGAVTLPTGDVLAVPHHRNIDIISPSQKKIIQYWEGPVSDKCFLGGILLPNGDVVLVPHNDGNIKVYRPDYAKPIFFPKEACESPYLNKL